jgi:hypothetical protein
MFIPIEPEIARIVREEGEIKFFVLDGWEFIAASELFTTVPHKVTYFKNFEYSSNKHYHIFNCRLSLEKYSLIVENIEYVTINLRLPEIVKSSKISKALEHMFMEMTLEAAVGMAKLAKKERLIVTSELTTFSEIASEAGFALRKPPLSRYYKAMKLLKPVKKVKTT